VLEAAMRALHHVVRASMKVGKPLARQLALTREGLGVRFP
jgi:hypothetical protein